MGLWRGILGGRFGAFLGYLKVVLRGILGENRENVGILHGWIERWQETIFQGEDY
jgi:hypothetical protein